MDINGDGGIDEEELLSCLIKLGLPCSPTYVAQMMKQYKDSQAVECGTGKQVGSTRGRLFVWVMQAGSIEGQEQGALQDTGAGAQESSAGEQAGWNTA